MCEDCNNKISRTNLDVFLYSPLGRNYFVSSDQVLYCSIARVVGLEIVDTLSPVTVTGVIYQLLTLNHSGVNLVTLAPGHSVAYCLGCGFLY